MRVVFNCPECEHTCVWTPAASPDRRCPGCDRRIEWPQPSEHGFSACAVCGERELYRKKAFPHGLGMLLLVLACAGFLIANFSHRYLLAWSILLGSALIDGLLYITVGDVLVCYRCNAHHRGIPPNPTHGPFELSIAERYRQEKLRREHMQAEKDR